MIERRWYLSTWFIALCFALWLLAVPTIVGIILLIMKNSAEKKRQIYWKENGLDDLEKIKHTTDKLIKESEKLEKQKETLLEDIVKETENLEKEIERVKAKVAKEEVKLSKDKDLIKMDIVKEEEKLNSIKKELVSYEEEYLYQTFGFYEPKYGFENSEEYKKQLIEIRTKQKIMANVDEATISRKWQVDGSEKKGEAMRKSNVKLAVRAFNQECDTAIAKAKFNNIDTIEKQLTKAREQINKLNTRNGIEIRNEYLTLKIEELYLVYEYHVKKEEEKEEQRILKEQMREEKRVQAEIERERKKLEKDEKHFQQALEKYDKQMETASEEMKFEIQTKIDEIHEKVTELQVEKAQVDFREQNAKAGYVYIISNIGSFGSDVFKIGMTRRLEPMDRVNELGSASVPFNFDVHAMVFSDDAPKLERALHKAFENYQVNKINSRKEFFRVDINEIAKVVRQNHNKTIEFTKLAEAEDYRKSLQLEQEELEKIEIA
ncbi:DUF4041 domain-containing protein [Alkalicoccobacillus plakortidis]|uniref:DUF4041 domain-containing protein n=1 Tax=Alkalicoccobacillus plakortidis TaxID=444060 RepID=A0ABT0XHB7_9BACI|nr:DUF4041 domain-containing protein [Alkalicoccobacillus plakortidis]MCM2674579.1 DUF4041 domain-containing protein [Alkalicoccobacillus plakortidis]